MKILIIVLASLLAGCAKAPAPVTNTPEAPPIKSTDVVKATPQPVTIAAGESGDALVSLQITNGYHINANPPTFSYLKATELEIKPAEGISVEFMTYPNALTKKFSFADKPLAVYEGETILKARLKADKSTKPGAHNLSAKLRVQACDESVCYAPGTLDVTVPVNIK
ncbi:MAG TPA: protein-disulfide reductase DsbD domain-containing protein [Pyrinomonadaceae bacterium]|jgi:DsbC/DsbD-like thiol-disulfide interchange protein|nr:protein-disulfide reductase DsbD domain-containing protein [Pyrinomonadaceae bacterium]